MVVGASGKSHLPSLPWLIQLLTFPRDAFKDMLDSIKLPFPECIELLRKNIKLDPGFKPFFDWCQSEGIPVIVLSSGMEPIIRALLTDLVGPGAEKIEIISNQVKIVDGGWEIVYHDDR